MHAPEPALPSAQLLHRMPFLQNTEDPHPLAQASVALLTSCCEMNSCSRATSSAFLPATGWPRFFSSSLSFTTVSFSTHSVPGIVVTLPAAAAGGSGDSDGAALGLQALPALRRPPASSHCEGDRGSGPAKRDKKRAAGHSSSNGVGRACSTNERVIGALQSIKGHLGNAAMPSSITSQADRSVRCSRRTRLTGSHFENAASGRWAHVQAATGPRLRSAFAEAEADGPA